MSQRSRGVLIISANDWGGNAESTDAIAECFAAEAITTATAMVFMADSERAAALATGRNLPMGLHLNLTEPFDAPHVPPDVRERQARMTRHFATLRLRRWTWSLRARRLVERCVTDQLQAFRDLYGREPTHVDGHNHVHASPDVFLSPGLAGQRRLRIAQTPTGPPGSPANLIRRVRTAAIARRFETTEYFFSFRNVHPAFGGGALAPVLDLAERSSVEIMVHPGYPDEHRILMSDAWRRELDGRPLGSYLALAS